jgi:hypothetical protein
VTLSARALVRHAPGHGLRCRVDSERSWLLGG